jgi:hypothetical protein
MILALIRNHFRFQELNLIRENPMIISTEKGLKRIRFWENEGLLKRHLEWRLKLLTPSFFIDRMYVTVQGFPYIRYDRFRLTCHDAPEEEAVMSGYEALWAEVMHTLLTRSRMPLPVSESSLLGTVQTYYEQAERADLFSSHAGKIAQSCYPSVCERAKIADQLRAKHQGRRRSFVLPDDFSFDQIKKLFDVLFINLGQSGPVQGYDRIAGFMQQVLNNQGESVMQALLQLMIEKGGMDQETSDLIKAAWYEPDEWIYLVDLLSGLPPGMELSNQHVNGFKKIWDSKNRLIALFLAYFEV